MTPESIIAGKVRTLGHFPVDRGLSSDHPHPVRRTWVNAPTTPTPWLQSCQFDVGRQEGLAGSAEVAILGACEVLIGPNAHQGSKAQAGHESIRGDLWKL
ncbi:uncharacterized protein PGTG_22216 [Puccinia graminis f. sp. tritici CRL 75-36-700-3]|uniref:Uncharacterized protein n=1 Tax=Puccinia graminis f. sp. tritici (strain CRL 75-36-700-3 / race SCCL) TaxID=418459 RepID=H6QTT2_PUCGT|nr:uncharacterized protein PGTG_22216 [Puccinia graminis f. sp. tritici CRL 75-36-700-3]EHS64346.1 hypothetical protein PGTG_22216 [Puccinia graminis f. sp. tritici CRL 75-36-700-3]